MCWFNIFWIIFKFAVLLFFHHYNLLVSAPLTCVLAHIACHRSTLLVAVLMTALVHCSHILRHMYYYYYYRSPLYRRQHHLNALATTCGHPHSSFF